MILVFTLPFQVALGDSHASAGTYAINLVAMVNAPVDGESGIALFTCADAKCRDFFGPNLDKVLIVAKAQGRKSAQRALFNFKSANMVKSGKSIGTKNLKGYVIGQDGQPGLAGKYMDHVGCTGIFSIEVNVSTPAMAMIAEVGSEEADNQSQDTAAIK